MYVQPAILNTMRRFLIKYTKDWEFFRKKLALYKKHYYNFNDRNLFWCFYNKDKKFLWQKQNRSLIMKTVTIKVHEKFYHNKSVMIILIKNILRQLIFHLIRGKPKNCKTAFTVLFKVIKKSMTKFLF